MDTVEKIRVIVAEQSGRPLAEIGPYSDLRTDLGLDSLQLVEIFVRVEDQCAVRIPEKDTAGWRTVGDIVEYVVAKVN
ncbi:acyl carrier protein [Nocardia goodfellowii]|uniref:Acyl carrier protein n=1 Tax=Nocardia goodfellowii TaxID=882446 RepID=A0ABS4Q7S5_9NOCA|nr:acyl carrier protein [Nocardia goodfellowii]MBP2187744.1 acyl carrier protein [Nocardia goodfellowii]